jgi:hypothetical protein
VPPAATRARARDLIRCSSTRCRPCASSSRRRTRPRSASTRRSAWLTLSTTGACCA